MGGNWSFIGGYLVGKPAAVFYPVLCFVNNLKV
jgi:hypothetical protein